MEPDIKYLVSLVTRNELGNITDIAPMLLLASVDDAESYLSSFPEEQRRDMRIRPVEYVVNTTNQHLPIRAEDEEAHPTAGMSQDDAFEHRYGVSMEDGAVAALRPEDV